MTESINFKFLDFFYKIKGGAVVPITKDDKRVPVVKFGADDYYIEKEKLISDYSFDCHNYSFKLPEDIVIIDVESHKGGLKEITDLKDSEGIDIFKTYHHITGRGGVHAFYKIKPNHGKRLRKGFLPGFKGVEILCGKNVLSPIPPSTHYQTGKPYEVGEIQQYIKNIKNLPTYFLDLYPEAVDGDAVPVDTIISESKFDDLEYCLKYLNPTKFRSYDKWIQILFSAWDFVKGHKKGLKIFSDWCFQDERYEADKKKINNLWKHVQDRKENDPSARAISYKTIMYHALKAGAKIKINLGKLIDEILQQNFRFTGTLENDGEYVHDIVQDRNIFENSALERIGGKKWARLTNGVIARIQGLIFDESGIMRKDFIEMRIKDKIERNRISIFKQAWDEIAFKHYADVKEIEDLENTKKLFFSLLKHKDKDYAEKVYPFFVRYLVGGVKANLEEFDDAHRSNSQTCLCINSEQQGIGKSTFARALSPCPDMIYYPNLKHIRDNETKLAISRASMCIIDDYQPTYQKELNNLNEILTQHSILARPKYGRIEIPKTKRAYFALTTNYKKILNDYSGTRRWINIDLDNMKIEKILEIMPRVHGEILSLARSGFRHWLNLEEIHVLEELNSDFSGGETLDAIILNHYDVDKELTADMQPSTVDIMYKVNKAHGTRTIRDVRQIGATIKRLFPEAEASRASRDGQRVRTYPLKMIRPFNPMDTVA